MRGVRSVAGVVLAVVMMGCGGLLAQAQRPSFHDAYDALGKFAEDACEVPGDEATTKLEGELFAAVDREILSALRASKPTEQPVERVRAALGALAGQRPVGSKWSKDGLFRFEVVDVRPMIVVKMGVRQREVFAAYAIADQTWPTKATIWQRVASSMDDEAVPSSSVDVRVLRRGLAGEARFLAAIPYSGCAGSTGITYVGYQWDPDEDSAAASATEMIHIEGSFGLDAQGGPVTKKNPFPTMGELQTAGRRITLPYCIWSKLDWWDNPSLCAVDTFDAGGDTVRWVSRRYNRPDLLPIAKVTEYAEKNEAAELRAFCGSDEVAKKLMAAGGIFNEADSPAVTVLGPGRERVVMDSGDTVEVEKRGGRWLVVGFRKAP